MDDACTCLTWLRDPLENRFFKGDCGALEPLRWTLRWQMR